ncbi:hypothetical protein GWK47_006873 [Chionoecetes opilio]|uniref:Uncharacterized protein n=1 Tax=Chionoecetes opilio TaxID=41210 RepID=A0A8J5CS00_CHIOP|nr:hypothetical protein GWK47_006873 [Chionoecetes opilio]
MVMDEVVQEATHFVARCYGCAIGENMSSTRYKVWIDKTSKRKVTSIPKLKSLPPTSEAFEQNVKRAHYQVIRCGCATDHSDQPCANARCMCGTAQMSCTFFCGCHGMEECCNRWTKKVSTTEENGDSDADDVDLSDD